MRRALTGALLAACIVALPRAAHATYSIVATDSATGQVGGAVTSCISGGSVDIVYGSAPGFGVVAAQAQLDRTYRAKNEAVSQLGDGIAPDQIIINITSLQFDAFAQVRQYGIVDLQGRAAGFTGSNTQSFADDRQGTSGTYTYSVQGNILTGPEVLEQAAAAFASSGCDLADKLMLALEAGADNGEGDSRCTSRGIPSDSAFIGVDRENETAGSYLRLGNAGTSPDNPITMLRAEYDDWRQSHPCPTGSGGTGGAAGSSGAGGSGAAGSGATSGSGGAGGAGAAGGGIGTGGAPASGGASGTTAAGGSTPATGGAGDDGGCGCALPAGTASKRALLVVLALAALVLRRRKR